MVPSFFVDRKAFVLTKSKIAGNRKIAYNGCIEWEGELICQ